MQMLPDESIPVFFVSSNWLIGRILRLRMSMNNSI